MGITGLLPFLEKAKVSKPANIKEFAGCTVAADAYCWLHKGAFSCADKLARGEDTDMYVQYCMKYVNMLLSHNIKPILVFDGRHLPAKAMTEKKRRQNREENRKKAANLYRQGHTTEALSYLRRCIDVTHKMALNLMKECRRRNIDCIVAPYEADSQLAFFSLEEIADLIITEDSDLLLFGCTKVMFKLDLAGNGILVEKERLHLTMGARPEMYSFDKFRHMCILSGCDYLDSLPGIGLGKACKFISRTQDPDIHSALKRLPSQLNIRGLTVPFDYRDNFVKADAMFRHQLVFDPLSKKTRPLTPFQNVHPASPLASGPLPGCEPEFDDETCYQLALGNLDPFKLDRVDNYDPDTQKLQHTGVQTNGWSQTSVASHPSIWDANLRESIGNKKHRVAPSFMMSEGRPVTKGKITTIDTSNIVGNKRKRVCETEDETQAMRKTSSALEEENLASLYASTTSFESCGSSQATPVKRPTFENHGALPTSPILSGIRRPRNPFVRISPSDTSEMNSVVVKSIEHDKSSSPRCAPSPELKKSGKFGALSKFARAIQRSSTEGKPIVESRYFNSSSLSTKLADPNQEEVKSLPNLLQDVSNTIQNDNSASNQLIIKGYLDNVDDSASSAMIHKKPLFAVSTITDHTKNHELQSNLPICGAEDGNKAECLQSIMLEKFSNQNAAPKLLSSNNPFKKKIIMTENIEPRISEGSSCKASEIEPNYQNITLEEDVDDPGFAFSPSSMVLSPITISSQSDEGFESPSKERKESPSRSQLTSSVKKQVCRISGLRKSSSSPGQSKLSAFGFVAKPKLHQS